MLHQVQAIRAGDPRISLLKELVDKPASVPEALSRLAAHHAASHEPYVTTRTSSVHADGHHFPHFADVPALLVVLAQQLDQLWGECRSHEDDVYVAAFGFFALYAIHPFGEAMERVAVDASQYLLMLRWELDQPVLDLPNTFPKHAAAKCQALFPPCDGSSEEAYEAAARALATTLQQATLASLKQTEPFPTLARWMLGALLMERFPTSIPANTNS